MIKNMNFEKNYPHRLCILSRDMDFATVLAYEAQKLGFDAYIKDSINAVNASDFDIFAVDVDTFSLAGTPILEKRVLGYSALCSGEELIGIGAPLDAILHKPFLMSNYRDILISFATASDEKAPSIAPIEKKDSERVYLDDKKREVVVCGESITLTENEYAVLSLLLENRGAAVSRAQIAAEIGCTSNLKEVDVYICFLRRKIDERLNLKFIRTVRGVGYEVKL